MNTKLLVCRFLDSLLLLLASLIKRRLPVLSLKSGPLERRLRKKGAKVGRWASASRRGTAKQAGFFGAPDVAGFSIGTVTATTIPVNRAATFPTAVTAWIAQAVNVVTASVHNPGANSGTPITITGLTTANTYRVYVAWANSAGVRLSDWALLSTTTTP